LQDYCERRNILPAEYFERRKEESAVLMRTDPFRDFDRLTQQVFGTPSRPAAMPIDSYRTGDTFIVEFDLPGVSGDSIDLTVERNVLTVHATRQRTQGDQTEMLVAERPFGTFSRQLFLGETLDSERIVASYTDGVLRLEIPVAEQAKPRKVDIQVAKKETAAITV
jgi:HSP20 family protein